jgi:hypothetical protein
MREERVREANADSHEWLKLRRFTDIIGERTLIKNEPTSSPYKIIGYLFRPRGEAEGRNSLCFPKDNGEEKYVGNSYDGYFEADLDSDDVFYPLHMFTVLPWLDVEMKTDTWVFAIQGNSGFSQKDK